MKLIAMTKMKTSCFIKINDEYKPKLQLIKDLF